MLQAFTIVCTNANQFKKRGKPVLTSYTVTAESQEDAIKLFTDECPAMAAESDSVSAIPCGYRVVRTI